MRSIHDCSSEALPTVADSARNLQFMLRIIRCTTTQANHNYNVSDEKFEKFAFHGTYATMVAAQTNRWTDGWVVGMDGIDEMDGDEWGWMRMGWDWMKWMGCMESMGWLDG